MPAIDLRYDDPVLAREIIGDLKPAMIKDSYLAFARGLFKKERWSGAVG
jgi:hypothetical protein